VDASVDVLKRCPEERLGAAETVSLSSLEKSDCPMRKLPPVALCFLALLTIASWGCRPASKSSKFPIEAGDYTILGIMTDQKDHARAKGNAEDTLTKYPNIACMVGLWAYNPPACLTAVRDAGKLGEVKIIGFDENIDTLQGIADDEIYGTIVQQPFFFGYKSVEYLAAMARGQEVKIPETENIFVPHRVITKSNVLDFKEDVVKMFDGKGTPPAHDRTDYDTSEKIKIAFISNSVDDFWTLAHRGIQLAEPQFNVECKFLAPPGSPVEEQKRYIEELLIAKTQGLAISPVDPEHQVDIINQACAVMPVICQDSDAPLTDRDFYLGTSNYMAGRAAGELIKEAIPDGGEVMIFVGKMEVINAQERSQGVIDVLLGKPVPEEFAEQADSPTE